MSNEMTIPGGLDIGFLRQRAVEEGDRQLQEAMENANPFKIMHRFKLDAESGAIGIFLGDDKVSEHKNIVFFPVMIAESRALYDPTDEEDNNRPICSTGNQRYGTFKRGADRGLGRAFTDNKYFDISKFLHEDDVDVLTNEDPAKGISIGEDGEAVEGQTLCRDCARCPWNKFETKPIWDPSEPESNSKACGTSRLIVGHYAHYDPDTKAYYVDEASNGAFIRLSSSSFKTVQKIIDTAAGYKVAPRWMAWEFSAKKNSRGRIKWANLEATHNGFPSHEGVMKFIDDQYSHFENILFAEQHDPAEASSEEVPF